jgi:hypothetical protein
LCGTLPREVERPLLVEMRQPPVAQRDRLARLVAAALLLPRL